MLHTISQSFSNRREKIEKKFKTFFSLRFTERDLPHSPNIVWLQRLIRRTLDNNRTKFQVHRFSLGRIVEL
jgi:hypothetical protein